MRIIEISPDIYERIDELSENYTNAQAFVKLSLKNYLSKKAVDMEPIAWMCGLSMTVSFRDAAERESKRCQSILSHDGRCGWLYRKANK